MAQNVAQVKNVKEEKGRKENQIKELKVSGGSVVEKVASALVRFIEEGNDVILAVIGANASNQALKAVIKANSFAAPVGFTLAIKPYFETLHIDGVDKSVIKMRIIKIA